jgi:peptide/nickel transport system substrate-binding protein
MEDITRRRFISLLGAAAGGSLLAACGGSDAAEPAGTSGASAAPVTSGGAATTTAAPTAGVTTSPAGTTVPPAPAGPAGTLRLGSPWPFTTFNPHDVLRAGTGGAAYWRVQFDSLIDRAEDGSALPALATEWDLTAEGVTLTLRDDVTFSDGTPFTAEVAKLNLENAAKDPRLMFVFGGITWEATSPTELKGTFPRPNPTFIDELMSNGGMMLAPSTIGQPVADTDPIGTGPWVYAKDESTPGQKYVFTIREGYWRPDIQGVERVEVFELADVGARGNALRSNQIDLTMFNDPSQVEIKEAGFELLSLATDVQSFLIMDREGSKVPALGNADVRKALSLAIERDIIANDLLNLSAVALDQLRAPGHPEYDTSLEGLVSYDIDQARTLMEGAGFADGFSMQLPFVSTWQLSLEAVQAMWAELNVNVEFVALSPAEFGPRNTSGEFPIAFLPAPGPDFAVQCGFFFGPGPVNSFKAADTDVLAAMMAAGSVVGPDRREKVIDLQRLTLEQTYFIPIVAGVKSAAYSPNVTGVAWTFDDLVPLPHGVRVS